MNTQNSLQESERSRLALLSILEDQKLIEESLRKSEWRFKQVAENAGEWIWEIDADGLYTYANPVVERIMGFKPEEIVGKKHFYDLFSPDIREELKQAAFGVFAKKEAFRNFVNPNIHKSGDIVILETSGTPFVDDKGNLLGYRGVDTDITERKRAEENLRASEAKLRATFAAMLDVIIVYDSEGRYLEIAPTNPSNLYRPPADMLGKTVAEVLPPEQAGYILEQIQRTLEKGEVNSAEYCLRLAENDVWFAALVSPLSANSVVWVAHDITKRKQAEEEILQRAARLAAINRISAALGSTLDLNKILSAITQQIMELFAVEHSGVLMFDEKKEWGHILAEYPERGATAERYKVKGYLAAERIIADQKPLMIEDTLKDPLMAKVREPMRRLGVKSMLIVPLVVKGETIGSLGLDAIKERRVFSQEEIELAQTIANQVSTAIENARLYEETNQRIGELELLYRATLAVVSTTLDLNTALNEIVTLLAAERGFPHVGIALVDEAGKQVILRAEHGIQRSRWGLKGQAIQVGQGLVGWVVQHGEPLLVNDVGSDQRYVIGIPETRSELVVPLRVGERVIGVINVESPHLNAFTPNDQRLLTTLAGQVAIAIENARLYEMERQARQVAESLREATTALVSSLEPDQVLDRILDEVQHVVPHDAANIALIEASTEPCPEPCPERSKGASEWDGEGSDSVRFVRWRGYERPGVDTQVSRLGFRIADTPGYRYMAETGQPKVVQDTAADPEWIQVPGLEWLRSYVGTPIRVREKLIGFLNLDSTTPGFFNAEHARLLATFAQQIGVALENARLYTQTQQRAGRLAMLNHIARALATTLKLDELLEIVHREIMAVMEADTFFIALYDREANELDFRIRIDEGVREPLERRPMAPGLTAAVVTSKQPLLIRDFEREKDHLPLAKLWGTMQAPQSWLGVPMLLGQNVVGVISVQAYPANVFGESEQELLSTIADAVAVAIENARLYAEIEQRASELGRLYAAAQDLATSLETRVVLEQLARHITQALDATSGYILETDTEKATMTVVAEYWSPAAIPTERVSDLGRVYPLQNYPTAIQAYQTGEVINYQADTPGLTELECREMADYGVKSILIVPIVARGKLLGEAEIWESRRERVFTQAEKRLAQALAQHAAGVIENARLYEAEQRRAARLAALQSLSTELATLREEGAVLNTLVARAAALAESPTCTVMLVDEAANEAVLAAQTGLPDDSLGLRVPLDLPILRRSLEAGEPLLIPNIDRDAPEMRTVLLRKDIHAFFAYPMMREGRVLGYITLSSFTPRIPSAEEITAYCLLAERAAAALVNARLYAAMERYATRLKVIGEIGQQIAPILDLDELLHIVVAILVERFGYYYANILLVDAPAGEIVLRASAGQPGRAYEGLRLKIGQQGITGWVAETRQPLLVNDVTQEPRYYFAEELKDTRSELAVPIMVKGQVTGVLDVQSVTKDAFDEEDLLTLQTLAERTAAGIENARLYQETTRRLAELSALFSVSSALRSAQTVDEMLPILLDETLAVINTEAGSIYLYDAERDEIRKMVARGWYERIPAAPMKPNPVPAQVLASGQLYLTREFAADPLYENIRSYLPAGWGGACLPLRAAQETIGLLFVAVQLPRQLSVDEIHLLTTLAEIAGNAIRRASLNEQTQRQVQRLASLRSIDMAISSVLDLRLTLNVVLEQTTAQLGMDAASVLLLNPHTQTLTYAAGRGFRTDALQHTCLRLGEGYAGRAALERQLIHIPDLRGRKTDFLRAPYFSAEGFVAYYSVPLIAKGQVKGVLEIFHRSTLNPDAEWMNFLETLANQAAIALDNAALFEGLQRSNLDLALAYDTSLEGWAKALELRDKETQGHTQRVTELTLQLARAMGVKDAEMAHLRRGALLHDIGKMGVPDDILRKPGPLTDEEWVIMRQHPQFAFEMLSPISYLRQALDIPSGHHEKWDGSGYPRGLKGEQIPLAARVFAVVDVWDALLSDRPYRKAWSQDRTMKYIRKQAGKHFDPQVVEAFLLITGDKIS